MTKHQISIEGTAQAFVQAEGDTLLQAALRAGIGLPYECCSGGCGSCKVELIEGDVENLWELAPGLHERDRRRNRLLACQCRATGPLRIKVRASDQYLARCAPLRRRATLLGSQAVTHDIREFRFATPGAADFEPGQYAQLTIPGVGAPRAYSMSNTGNADGEWHFQIRRVAAGKASEQLFEQLRPGDEIGIDGPYGLASLRTAAPRDLVCIAGGSGLAPMISIARGAAQAGMLQERLLHFFYGARTARDVCGEELLRALPGFGERILYHPVVSEPGACAQAPWSGATGFVHDAVKRVLGARLPECEFYFAGPPRMTQSLQEMLMLEFQVPFERLHFDRFF